MVRAAAAEVVGVGHHDHARRAGRKLFAHFFDEREERAVLGGEMALAPVLAGVQRCCGVGLAHQIQRPAQIEYGPGDDEQRSRDPRQCGDARAATGAEVPQCDGEQERGHEQEWQREFLHLGAAGHRVDRRTAPVLEYEPLLGAVGKNLDGAHRLRDDTGDAQRLRQRRADGQRDTGDAPDPVRVPGERDGQEPARFHGERHRMHAGCVVIGAPEQPDVTLSGNAGCAPRDRRILARPEIRIQGDEGKARGVDRGDDQRIAVQAAAPARQRQVARGPGPGGGARKPVSRDAQRDIDG